MISVRMKKYSEQMMKVHMVKTKSISNILKCDWWEKEKQFGGKRPKKSNTNHHNKPLMCDIYARKRRIQNFKRVAI